MIGVICASEVECSAIIKAANLEKKTGFPFELFCGVGLVMAKSGMMQSAAEDCTMDLVSRFGNLDMVFSVGVAGGLAPNLNIGDIVVSGCVVQYPEMTSHSCAQTLHYCDVMYNRVESFCRGLSGKTKYIHKAHKGIQICSDEFVNSRPLASSLYQNLHGISVDMESAGVFRACLNARVPVCSIKVISDYSNELSAFYIQRHEEALSFFMGSLINNIVLEGIDL